METEIDMDIDRIRAETPGVATIIHLNNCGASLIIGIVMVIYRAFTIFLSKK